jgi:hypothetical protein
MPDVAFRDPRKITDLAEFAGDYIEFMRATPQSSTCDFLVRYAADFFADVAVTEVQLKALTTMFVDRIYRFSADLIVLDSAVTTYFATVTRYVLDFAAARGVRILYILDNELRNDRFELACQLLFLAGVFVVAPYRIDGTAMPVDEALSALKIELLAGRHVAYIEKDATANYLGQVLDAARLTTWHVIFRNQAPTNPEVQHVPSAGH